MTSRKPPAGFIELPYDRDPDLASPENNPFRPEVRALDFLKLFYQDANYETIADETNCFSADRISDLDIVF